MTCVSAVHMDISKKFRAYINGPGLSGNGYSATQYIRTEKQPCVQWG
jgi:hypothetical protein